MATTDGEDAAQGPATRPFAEDMLRRLFPAPHEVSLGAGSRPGLRLYALPSAASARYLVPSRPRRVAAQMVGRQLLGRRLRTRAARLAAVTTLRLGIGTPRWPARFTVGEAPGAPSVLSWLRSELGEPDVVCSIGLGRPRANRKPVLQVADRTGRTLGYAKVGHDPLTRELVSREADALAALAQCELPGIEVPRLLARTSWGGLELLLMSVLDTETGTADPDRARLVSVVSSIARARGTQRLAWRRTPLATSLRAALHELGDVAADLAPTLDELDRRDPELTIGAWHGDLNPGNLTARPGEVMVWDWERFENGVPLGFDLLHHDLQAAVTVRSVAPADAARTLVTEAGNTLEPLGVTGEQARATVLAYLVTLGLRFLRDRQAEAGAALGRVDEWLVPALTWGTAPRDRGAD